MSLQVYGAHRHGSSASNSDGERGQQGKQKQPPKGDSRENVNKTIIISKMWPLTPLTLLAVLAVAVLADATDATALGALGLDTLEEDKRAPMGFNGMRGKKDDLLDDGFDKRGGNSLGFSGMRGKKSDEDADDALAMDKRARNQLGFSGMRGKKDDYDEAVFTDKRARNQLGFSGMRGKKDDYDVDADGAALFDKRTRNTLGFSGMRGKKASSDEFVLDDLDKRAKNQLGFSGMRGKKGGMDDVEAYLAKRARQAAFVGMRGRRENAQAFFGMRGKRNPGDGYGAYDSLDEDGVISFLRSPEATRDGVVTYRSKRYLPSTWQLRNSKKAPFSGFIGLRGKKSVFVPAPSFLQTDEQRDLAQ